MSEGIREILEQVAADMGHDANNAVVMEIFSIFADAAPILADVDKEEIIDTYKRLYADQMFGALIKHRSIFAATS